MIPKRIKLSEIQQYWDLIASGTEIEAEDEAILEEEGKDTGLLEEDILDLDVVDQTVDLDENTDKSDTDDSLSGTVFLFSFDFNQFLTNVMIIKIIIFYVSVNKIVTYGYLMYNIKCIFYLFHF